ncbi:Rossmann-like and DUF2520 domain-containing protein [Protofrankia symbiont of Coriaria ruscifolia]|uniref:DUF2520 domain-containing protein n=1 Tax=Candidatus Protofrankia californiensis TaxID=1839754 RepID=A0A1C3PGA6_9ACTN|nr:Rossmann-like and DUF2520 domain-containing protein [Protofrankia symbiont of Coriaria ruscifolia]SBW28668.1 hypothetical protein FDG2_5835 [Candidatus Protofrankia californiensis]
MAGDADTAKGVDAAAQRPVVRTACAGGKPRVGIVGLGRAGSALGTALSDAGYPVVAVHARSVTALERARVRFPAAWVGTPAAVAEASDVAILTVSDDMIRDVAGDIASAGALRAGQVVVHASGRHGTDVLHPVLASGAFRAAVHPIMTLSGAADDAGRLAGAGFGVTADPGAQPVVNALVTAVGGRVVSVPEQARTAYHAAVVLGANYLATLVTATLELLETLGVGQPADAVAPLLEQSLRNALERGPAALTGPVRRGDTETVRAHLGALAALDQSAASAYAALAALTVDQLERAGLAGVELAAGIRDVLGTAGG